MCHYLSPQFEKNADIALEPKRFEILIFVASVTRTTLQNKCFNKKNFIHSKIFLTA